MAVQNCETSSDNSDLVANLDKAVALYVGSEARESGTEGFFPFSLTQVECYKFGTCAKGAISPVNTKILGKFLDTRYNLSNGKCSRVSDNVVDIKSLMTILLVQGLTRSMYEIDLHDDFQETTQGRATAFAAAVLPLVNACSKVIASLYIC